MSSAFPTISEDIYTSLSSGKNSWPAEQLDNISLIYRRDARFSGVSALETDLEFGYVGAQGDIVLNLGGGTSGAANDVITPGGDGGVSSFRTYFDTGGADTVNLANYAAGAYLHMGTTITRAPYPVDVSMSAADRNAVVNLGKDPGSLRSTKPCPMPLC